MELRGKRSGCYASIEKVAAEQPVRCGQVAIWAESGLTSQNKENPKMNYPAASCGVSEKPELLPMQLRIVRTLISDVLRNACFIAMLPNRAHEIPVAPKLSSPKLLLHFRTVGENLPRRKALDHLHDFLGLYIGTDCTKK